MDRIGWWAIDVAVIPIVMLSEAKHLPGARGDPSLSLRMTAIRTGLAEHQYTTTGISAGKGIGGRMPALPAIAFPVAKYQMFYPAHPLHPVYPVSSFSPSPRLPGRLLLRLLLGDDG
ncbi:MAG: hypothetical protein ACYC66_06260 [Chloroflexota bacterium]